MSEPSQTASPKRHLVLLLPGAEGRDSALIDPTGQTELFTLNESTARQALDKIFAADTVAVWGSLGNNQS